MRKRDIGRLSAAAFGGALMGAALVGCSQGDSGGSGTGTSATPPTPPAPPPATTAPSDAEPVSLLMQEPHVCRGLNTCKGHGAGGKNECAGTGACATATAHGCHGHNDCKGQGGCEATAGENACKGKGNCAVPLGAETWKATRAKFEAAMKKAGKTVGEAPAPAKAG